MTNLTKVFQLVWIPAACLAIGCTTVLAKAPSGQSQSLSFSSIPGQTYGNGPVPLQALASSGLPVSFTVTKGPARISGSTLTLLGAGSVTVRASQSGGSGYMAAKSVDKTFNVAQAQLTAKAADQSVVTGQPIPALTVSYTGFVNGDSASVLDKKPVASVKIKNTAKTGTYPISLSAGKDNNYSIRLQGGTLSVMSVGTSSGSVFMGGGTLTVGNPSTYPGNTTVNPGNLTLSPGTSLGSAQSGPLLTPPMIAGQESLPAGVTVSGNYLIEQVTTVAVYIEGDMTIKTEGPVALSGGIHVDGNLYLEGNFIFSGQSSSLHATGTIQITTSTVLSSNPASDLTLASSSLLNGNETLHINSPSGAILSTGTSNPSNQYVLVQGTPSPQINTLPEGWILITPQNTTIFTNPHSNSGSTSQGSGSTNIVSTVVETH